MEVTNEGKLYPNPFTPKYLSVINAMLGKSKASEPMKKILIIEDSKPFRRLVEFILTKANYEVISAKDGFEAIYRLSEGEVPDLIITDIEMPNFTGEELITNLFNSGLFSYIPVIILTGIESETVKEKCIASGAYAYLNKPFDPTELLKYVEDAIEASKAKLENK
jgi:CheY-like chemotaxis protein